MEFKLACLVHQSLAEQTPSSLASDIQLTTNTGRPQLRSASERICVVPRTHNSFGDKSFSAAGPRVWNLASISAAGHELQPLQACTERTLCLDYSRPRRTVTNLLSCALEAHLLTYLLTYLLSYLTGISIGSADFAQLKAEGSYFQTGRPFLLKIVFSRGDIWTLSNTWFL